MGSGWANDWRASDPVESMRVLMPVGAATNTEGPTRQSGPKTKVEWDDY